MNTGNPEIKRIIVNNLTNAGINISPSMLELILKIDNPIEKLNIIIKQLSFIPTFNSHLTENILKKISDKEIQKILKRATFREKIYSSEDAVKVKDDTLKKSNEVIDNDNLLIHKSEITENIPKTKNSVKIKEKQPRKIKKTKASLTKLIKKKVKITHMESTKSAFSFKPSAKDFNFNYKILRDPTGKLYTNGGYNDFYELTLDKFNRLRNLMKKRPEALSATNIINILRNSQSVNISTTGLVNEMRETKKGNYFLTIEDMTGSINVLVRKDSENQESRKLVEKTINDQMIFVQGNYRPPGDHGGKGIIFANSISKIDIPTDHSPNLSPDPVSIALISDSHIGSKEFEEKLMLRFIKFLKGKIGNKNFREIAGRVKYIIINGDLVDGVGVYPAQKEDLNISDIYQQYKKAAEFLSEIPDYIKVFYSSGNHDPVRNAIPRPAVPAKYTEDLINLDIKCLGNPCVIKTHNVSTLVFHGDSMIDMNMLVPGLENNKPVDTMKELLICRHMAPIFGKKTQIAPVNRDWLVIDKVPDIFHTGHIHINGMGRYRGVSLVNSGCFQSQTQFMAAFGIRPTPGIVPIVELDSLQGIEIDLKKFD